MSDSPGTSVAKWWATLAVGTAAALLITWLAHATGVSLRTLLSIVAGGAALGWLIVLVAVPWNLYFAARGARAQMVVSRARGIVVRDADDAEARRIERRMLWFALGGHALTAAATAVITYESGTEVGYYFAGFYLLSATIRPGTAYLSHLRQRITTLTRDSVYPREDVLTLRSDIDDLAERVRLLTDDLAHLDRAGADNLHRAEAKLADELAHARRLLTADLSRLQDAQATDREAARAGDEDLGRRVDRIARRIEGTLDGISDHQELQTGLRALIRLIRADSPT